MCRMMAVARSSTPTLRDLAARFRVEAHQGRVGAGMAPGHRDGWGIVVAGREGDLQYAGRSTRDAGEDAEYPRAVGRVAGATMLVHFRKATAGAHSVENSHPFIAGGLAFAHNGTAFDIVPDGESDSRELFARLLAERRKGASVEDALAAMARSVPEPQYSSLTTLVTDGASVWGLRKIGTHPKYCTPEMCAPDYYTLGYATLADGSVVVSQEHELLGIEGWSPVREGDIITVTPDGRVATRRAW
jgi:glutamine amidotransferase